MGDPTVIAVDWSGAKKPKRLPGIAVCAIAPSGEEIIRRNRWSREEVVDFVSSFESPVVVGFDFSFGLPAWFASELGCQSIDHVWARAEADGEVWLRPTEPFWASKRVVPLEKSFRQCEESIAANYRAKPAAIFALVGAKMVGKGSVRGMPLLATLRSRGFSIWPFDAPSDRMVIEIYPSLLREIYPNDTDEHFASDDERDAVESARAMHRHRTTFKDLAAATDPVTRLEGDVWTPRDKPA